MNTRTLEDLEGEIADSLLPELLKRHRVCAGGSHIWKPLDAPQLTAQHAEWCGWCLRVRFPMFEGWPQTHG